MYWGLSKSAPPRVTSDVHSGAFRMVPQAAPSFHCLCSYTRRVVVGLLGVHAAFNPTKFNPEAVRLTSTFSLATHFLIQI